MRNYILLVLVMFSLSSYSQFNNGMQQRNRQRQMNQTPRTPPKPNYEVEKYLGIVVYDIEKAAKKSSIKLNSDVGKQFSTILKTYNRDISDFRRINSFTLNSTKKMVESFQKKAQETRSAEGSEAVQKKMASDLKPITATLKVKDIALDKQMKSLLSEKQYKKWIKYNRKLYKFFPDEDEIQEEE